MREPVVIPQNPRKPRTGVVAMIDALAFKGIWARYGFENVLDRLDYIQAQAELERKFQAENHPKLASAVKFELTVRFLSDTIVIAAHSSAQLQSTRGFLVDNAKADDWAKISTDIEHNKVATEFVALKVVVGVLARALGGGMAGSRVKPHWPILNYRGAISYGEYLLSDNFLIGQAIDDCGASFEQSEGAFVFFHPTATEFWGRCQAVREDMQGGIVRTGQLTVQDIKSYMKLPEVVEYDVPLKAGTLPTRVVNPLARARREEWSAIRDTMLAEMNPKVEDLEKVKASIQLKRDNTAKFLSHVIEYAPTCFPPAPPSFEEALRILERPREEASQDESTNFYRSSPLNRSMSFVIGASLGFLASYLSLHPKENHDV